MSFRHHPNVFLLMLSNCACSHGVWDIRTCIQARGDQGRSWTRLGSYLTTSGSSGRQKELLAPSVKTISNWGHAAIALNIFWEDFVLHCLGSCLMFQGQSPGRKRWFLSRALFRTGDHLCPGCLWQLLLLPRTGCCLRVFWHTKTHYLYTTYIYLAICCYYCKHIKRVTGCTHNIDPHPPRFPPLLPVRRHQRLCESS